MFQVNGARTTMAFVITTFANAPLTLFLSYIRGPTELDDYWPCRCSYSDSGYSEYRDADLLE